MAAVKLAIAAVAMVLQGVVEAVVEVEMVAGEAGIAVVAMVEAAMAVAMEALEAEVVVEAKVVAVMAEVEAVMACMMRMLSRSRRSDDRASTQCHSMYVYRPKAHLHRIGAHLSGCIPTRRKQNSPRLHQRRFHEYRQRIRIPGTCCLVQHLRSSARRRSGLRGQHTSIR